MTASQRVVLGVLAHTHITRGRPMSARAVARVAWPDDPGWARRTSGRSASRHNGALGATMPLRAGRVLHGLRREGWVTWHPETAGRSGAWSISDAGLSALDADHRATVDAARARAGL